MKPLLLRVRAELAKVADPKAAPIMQAYMKSTMPYHGVNAPTMRAVAKSVSDGLAFADARAWRDELLAIFRGARFREEWYVAITLAASKASRPFRDLDALPMYEEMIVTGAWWDVVDYVSRKLVGDLLMRHPGPMKRTMRAWSRCKDPWKRRTSIIAQNGFRAETDRALLYACIEPSIGDKGFFLRKAIGWALREYAKAEPDEVRRYVREREGALSPLSRREAMKHL